MLYGNKQLSENRSDPLRSVAKRSTVTLNQTLTNALMSSVYVIHMCLFLDALLKRVLFLVTLHAVDHFQNITGIYEEAEVGSFCARDQVQ